MKIINQYEFKNVISLSAEKRYEYCIKRIADNEMVWSLHNNDGWALSFDDNCNEVIPIWPYKEFAQAYANGHWVHFDPTSIELTIWIEKWIPGIKRDVSIR